MEQSVVIKLQAVRHRLRLGQRGASLVEVLLAIGLTAILLPALATALVTSRSSRAQSTQQLQANTVLHETNEAVRAVREKGWNGFAVNGTYYPTVSGSAWSLTAGTQTTNGLTRQVVISDAQRNTTTQAIVDGGGTVDPSTKKVVTTISWTMPFAASISSTAYYTRWQNNAVLTDTTQADFTANTLTNTVATNTAGGEVRLASTAPNWTTPSIVGSYNISGSVSGLSVFVSGNYAYVGYASSLAIFNITNPAAPTLVGTYAVGAAVNGVYVSGNYAYLATNGTLNQLVIVNVSNPALPTLASGLLLLDLTAAKSVTVSGGYAYVTKLNNTLGPEFFVVNVSNPAAPTVSGSYEAGVNLNAVEVSGNYAYVASANTSRELTVINITTKTAPAYAGAYNGPGTGAGTDVVLNGTTAYLTTNSNTSAAEVYAISVATPTAPTLVGSFEVGGNATGIALSGTYAYVTTAVTAKQFITLNITTPASMSQVSALSTGSTLNAVVGSASYAYVGSADTTKEFTIIGGGASGYQTAGTMESATFDAGASAAYNYVTFSATQPASTSVRFQIAVNNDNSTWNYVGPDGTAATYYTAASSLPYATIGRYMRYKATFAGTSSATPILQDITVNYSP